MNVTVGELLGDFILIAGSFILLLVLVKKYAWSNLASIFEQRAEKIFEEDKNKRNIVINFNYTTYLREMDYISEMTNVHGTFENPIFGIDNTEIGNDREFYYLTKTSRVLFNNTIKEDFKLPNKIEISKICFFGHSLARADYSYFQSIFDYYDIYSSNIKLNFMYSEYDKNDLTRAKRETHNNVVKLMNNYGEKLENKDKGKNLLHKLLIENRIKLINVDKENKIIDNSNYSFN